MRIKIKKNSVFTFITCFNIHVLLWPLTLSFFFFFGGPLILKMLCIPDQTEREHSSVGNHTVHELTVCQYSTSILYFCHSVPSLCYALWSHDSRFKNVLHHEINAKTLENSEDKKKKKIISVKELAWKTNLLQLLHLLARSYNQISSSSKLSPLC